MNLVKKSKRNPITFCLAKELNLEISFKLLNKFMIYLVGSEIARGLALVEVEAEDLALAIW